MYREIKGSLIRHQRGSRSLKFVASLSDNHFSDVSLLMWENEKWKPRPKNIPHLLKALGCRYEDISADVDLGDN